MSDLIKYYIFDTTLPKPDYIFFDSISATVSYLEKLVQKVFHKTRKQYMDEMSSLGHGYDDNTGEYFTQILSEYINIGIVKNNKPVKCNIHQAQKYRQSEYGD